MQKRVYDEQTTADSLTWLTRIYGADAAERWHAEFMRIFERFASAMAAEPPGTTAVEVSDLDAHSAILITYGDSIRDHSGDGSDPVPLEVLLRFLRDYVGSAISTVHILPCYPSSSDDGFSVVDPFQVDASLGTWDDIEDLTGYYRLMLDFVANHLSVSNEWIRRFLDGDPQFADFAITMEENEDLKAVFRPRLHPLLTPLETPNGIRRLWTTFSADQIDLNYHNPHVLLRMTEVLLSYIRHGASIIRLDAVAFIWKELGSACIHHHKTHLIIQYLRWILDTFAPGRLIITETNVPHLDNISYFGDGSNEASLVYNFPLPPLVLHTFLAQDATCLADWLSSLSLPSDKVAFFNFLSSHDGIGLVPVRDLLPQQAIGALADHVVSQGGFISRKINPDGSSSPYELNINYYSALGGMVADEPQSSHIDRFVAATAIMLCLQGIPGVYIHSLLGSANWEDAPHLASHPRKINREKLDYHMLCAQLDDPLSRRSQILSRYLQLLHIRRSEPALQTTSAQKVLDSGCTGVLALLRIPPAPSSVVLCLVNVTATSQILDSEHLFGQVPAAGSDTSPSRWQNLLAGYDGFAQVEFHTPSDGRSEIVLAPYGVVLLKHWESI
ncbi:MAG: alpha-amylase family glycosyl hydrolase [Sphaerochaeta sp.]|nr:alpha-amylase family glycosyl hydrolase [Sphaerochaeta sp.]